MLLGLLLGNSSLRFGAHDGRSLVGSCRVAWGDLDARASDLQVFARRWAFEEVLVGSVRDDLYPRAAALLPAGAGPVRFARRDFPIPIENLYEPPEAVGTDRLLNAMAVRSLAAGRGAIIVDFGTALSLSVVTPRGAFAGGLIAAGVRSLLLGLEQATPRLPPISPAAPARLLQRQTVAAIQAGVAWQIVGAVRAMVHGLAKEIEALPPAEKGRAGPPLVVATGGDAELFASHLPEIHSVISDLTLQGLFLARLGQG